MLKIKVTKPQKKTHLDWRHPEMTDLEPELRDKLPGNIQPGSQDDFSGGDDDKEKNHE